MAPQRHADVKANWPDGQAAGLSYAEPQHPSAGVERPGEMQVRQSGAVVAGRRRDGLRQGGVSERWRPPQSPHHPPASRARGRRLLLPK